MLENVKKSSQDGLESEASLGHIARCCFKQKLVSFILFKSKVSTV